MLLRNTEDILFIIPANKIDLTLGGKKIDVASNFTLTYGENKEVGEGTVTLTPKNNNFTGTKTLTFKICGEMLSTDPGKRIQICG